MSELSLSELPSAPPSESVPDGQAAVRAAPIPMDPAATVLARKERLPTRLVVISFSLREEGMSDIVLLLVCLGMCLGMVALSHMSGYENFCVVVFDEKPLLLA